jgi:hypothetical protein
MLLAWRRTSKSSIAAKGRGIFHPRSRRRQNDSTKLILTNV